MYITVSGVEMLDEHKHKFYQDTNETIEVLYSDDEYTERCAEEQELNRFTITYTGFAEQYEKEYDESTTLYNDMELSLF